MSQTLGEMLVASGALSEAALREAQAYQRNGGLRLDEALSKLALVDEGTLYRALAKEQGLPFVDLDKGRIAPEVLARVPPETAREQGLVPVLERNGRLVVAIEDPTKRILVDQLRFALGVEVAAALAQPSALKRAIARYYGAVPAADTVARSMKVEDGDQESDAPIVRLVTRTFQQALEARASDIHVEPGRVAVRVRFRVDGLLRDAAEHPLHLHAPLISRLKIMASMDIAERRKPQDGRIGLTVDGREIDVRCSILPASHGETMVMRLLDRSRSLISLRELGFEDDDYRWFRRQIRRPNGIVLVTGPTGSGKTTTLYGALTELNRPDVKILTAEDPVEYHIPGINQVQVNTRIGLTFARILKAMLRAAPNVILVGEIRDHETAEIAIQSALTGHLVFSTLHTNDAPSALTRLVDIGVAPFLVSASVQAVVAQRLVRRLCRECAEGYTPVEAEVRAMGFDPALVAGRQFKRARGCRACDGSGYKGRIAVFELLEMDAAIRELVFRESGLEAVRERAAASGALRPLVQDGARKVLRGETSVSEVVRVTRLAAGEDL
ncbi:MAG: type II/IV secretion system protein [Planctomycetes bacterium]|nr:type II/IV secretion system protein [Planctomycetota bacterium]